MAEQIVSDLLMKFVDSSGRALDSESSTELALKPAGLLEGFTSGKFFEISSFKLNTGLGSDELATQFEAAQQALAKRLGAQIPDRPHGRFLKFRRGPSRPGESSPQYPVDMKPISFERLLDRTSSVLLQKCIEREIFQSAALIKRKPAGSQRSGEAFLRYDFTQVMLTKVAWQEGDPIREDCEFVCRGLSIRYLPQLQDGSFHGVTNAQWKSADDVTLVKT